MTSFIASCAIAKEFAHASEVWVILPCVLRLEQNLSTSW